MHYYVINKDTGARLCQDNRWREFAGFGTFSSCAKVYRSRGWAERRVERYRHAMVLGLASHLVIDAAGMIFDESEEGQSKLVGHCLDMKPRII